MTNRDHLAAVPAVVDETVHDGVVVSDLAFNELPGAMWDLPSEITGDLADLHRSLVDGLRRDARHMPTGVLAALQLERVAYFYIRIRWHEANGWARREDRGAFYKYYRDAANDLASQSQSKKINPEELHQIVSQHTAKIVANVLRTMPTDQAKPLYRRFAAALDESAPAS